jgi:hypothetical protein
MLNISSKNKWMLGIATAISLYLILKYFNDNKMENKDENSKGLSVIVKGNYKGRGCDELHAFQSTGGRTIGGMNTKVNAELKKMYEKGINPEITDVKVVFDTKNMTSNWEVTINESKDGKAWLGITSRGSSGNKSAYERAYNVQGQRPADIMKNIKKTGEDNAELKLIKDWIWNFDKNKNVIGKCPTRQLFYSYTMPTLYPAHKK